MEKLFGEEEAALILGITRELLVSFVKNGAKGKKLNCISKNGRIYYDSAALLEWDTFLKQPWAAIGSKRVDIPSAIKDYLKVESQGKCVRCGNGHRLDYAHITPWNESYSHHPHNLIRLCTDCHVKYDDGIILHDEIFDLKQRCISKLKTELLSNTGFRKERYGRPLPTLVFAGREAELNKLGQLYNTSNCLLIDGVGGIGKTQLILRFIAKNDITADWFALDEFQNVKDLQIAIADRYGVLTTSEFLGLLNKMQETLIFDGFENLLRQDWDNAISFLTELSYGLTAAKLIVISQIDIGDVSLKATGLKIIQGLSIDDSKFVIGQYVGQHDLNDEAMDQLISFSDGHPLTLIILGSLIKYLNSAQKVIDALEQFGVDVLEKPKKQIQDRSSSLEICLELSYTLLSPSNQATLKYLSLFPAGHKTQVLKKLVTDDGTGFFKNSLELDKALANLDQFNFLQRDIDPLDFERISMLNPIRTYLRKKFDVLNKDTFHIKLLAFETLMIEAVVVYKQYMLSDEVDYGLLRYELDLQNYLFAFRESVKFAYETSEQFKQYRKRFLRLITGFTAGLYKYLFTRGHFQYGIYFNQEGAKAHQALGEYDLAIEDLSQVGTLLHRRYRIDEANKVLAQMKELEKKCGEENGLIRILEGQLLQREAPYQAIAVFKKGLAWYERKMKENKKDVTLKVNRASIIMEIGKTYEMFLNDDRSALPFYLESYNIEKRAKDFSNLYCTSHHLGNAYTGLDQPKQALSFYQEALIGFIELGQQQYISNSFSEIGKIRVKHPKLDFSFLTDEVVEAGMEDIENEIKLSYNAGNTMRDYRMGNLPTEVFYKLWNIIRVVTLSYEQFPLERWAKELIDWFEEKMGGQIPMAPLPWYFLRIAELSAIVRSNPKDDESLYELKAACYLYGSEADNDLLEPYEWLALWLREKKIDPEATSDALMGEVEGREGIIPGF